MNTCYSRHDRAVRELEPPSDDFQNFNGTSLYNLREDPISLFPRCEPICGKKCPLQSLDPVSGTGAQPRLKS